MERTRRLAMMILAIGNSRTTSGLSFTMHILIVEDEQKIAAFIKRGLTENGFVVDVAEDGEQGLEYALAQENGSHHSRCRAAQA